MWYVLRGACENLEEIPVKLEVISRDPQGQARPAPILFVHGMWHGAWCWEEYFMPYFAQRGYTVHALSLRGHGASEGNKRFRWTSIADYVADVAQVVDRLPEAPVLVGHSMGGGIVQKYLESHQAPAAVLLAAAPPKGLLPATLRFVRRHLLAFLKVNLQLSMWPVVATPELAREGFFSAAMPEEQVRTYHDQMGNEAYRAYLDLMLLNLPRPGRVTTPLLVLGASRDTLISAADVKSTARAYGTQAEFFDMAHDMMLEDGWEAVADRIRAWLDEQGL
jgi:pimeloyl-ACP methyl ester carboxylesterase